MNIRRRDERAPRWSLALACAGWIFAASDAVGQRRIPITLPGQRTVATPFELALARGDQALGQGRLEEARAQFEQAAALDARDARPSFYLGEVARRQDQWAVAETRLREALARAPRMAEAHASLGAVLRERERLREATAEYTQAIRLDPQMAEAHHGLALCLEDAGDREGAIRAYRTAVRQGPSDPMPALNLGILLASGRPARGTQPRAEALSMLQTAMRAGAEDAVVLSSAGPALRLLGEHASAADALERARARTATPSASLLGELAQALWASGRRPEALARIGEALRRAPTAAELHYVRALMQLEQGDRAGATASLRAVVQHGGSSPLVARARERLAQRGPGR